MPLPLPYTYTTCFVTRFLSSSYFSLHSSPISSCAILVSRLCRSFPLRSISGAGQESAEPIHVVMSRLIWLLECVLGVDT